MTNNMGTMLEPLQKSIDSLIQSKQEWELHKTEVTELKSKQVSLVKKLSDYSELTDKLTKRVKDMEEKLMELNVIMHGIKESHLGT